LEGGGVAGLQVDDVVAEVQLAVPGDDHQALLVPPASSTRALPEGRQRSKTMTLGV
jgi:hypothetical protein